MLPTVDEAFKERVGNVLEELKKRAVRIKDEGLEFDKRFIKEYDGNYHITKFMDPYSLINLKLAIVEIEETLVDYYKRDLEYGIYYLYLVRMESLYQSLYKYRCENKRPLVEISRGLFYLATAIMGYFLKPKDFWCGSRFCNVCLYVRGYERLRSKKCDVNLPYYYDARRLMNVNN